MPTHTSTPTVDGAVWDAQTMLTVGIFIRQHLHAFPPPAGARYAHDFQDWRQRLSEHGTVRLAELGPRRLTTA